MTQVWFSAPTWRLPIICYSSPRASGASSGRGHQIHTWNTNIYAVKPLIHIQLKIFKKRERATSVYSVFFHGWDNSSRGWAMALVVMSMRCSCWGSSRFPGPALGGFQAPATPAPGTPQPSPRLWARVHLHGTYPPHKGVIKLKEILKKQTGWGIVYMPHNSLFKSTVRGY